MVNQPDTEVFVRFVPRRSTVNPARMIVFSRLPLFGLSQSINFLEHVNNVTGNEIYKRGKAERILYTVNFTDVICVAKGFLIQSQ